MLLRTNDQSKSDMAGIGTATSRPTHRRLPTRATTTPISTRWEISVILIFIHF
uniref:Uncharacterized protein n=1 Tax=Heterorhabditis bacteriophora TaxID=37862 RepID=A0A1I7WII1_HETBA